MIKNLVFVILFICSSSLYAAGWSKVGNVTRVHSGHGAGVMYFTTDIQLSNPVCSDNTKGYTFSDNAINTDRMYSLLLSAYVSKLPVSIYITDTCLSGRPQISAVQYKDDDVAF